MIRIVLLAAFFASCVTTQKKSPGLSKVEVKVESGDTLNTIARQYNTSWEKLVDWNKAALVKGLRVGQILTVYTNIERKFPQSQELAQRQPLSQSRKNQVSGGIFGVAALDETLVVNTPASKNLIQEKMEIKDENVDFEGELSEDIFSGRSLKKVAASDDSTFGWPVAGSVSSFYGPRRRKFHKGIDIRGAYGTPIRAAAAGRVIAVRFIRGYGKTVIVDHGAYASLYAHASKYLTKNGSYVAEGDVIANVGTTGNARGSHLHFEIRDLENKPVDPFPLLDKKFMSVLDHLNPFVAQNISAEHKLLNKIIFNAKMIVDEPQS